MDNSSSSRTATATARRRSGRFSLGSLQKATISLSTRWWRKQSITTRRPSHQNDELAESTGSGNSNSPRRPSQDQRTNSGREESTSPGGSRPSFLRGRRRHRFPGTRKAQEDAFLEFLDQNDHSIFLRLQQDQQEQQNSNEDHR